MLDADGSIKVPLGNSTLPSFFSFRKLSVQQGQALIEKHHAAVVEIVMNSRRAAAENFRTIKEQFTDAFKMINGAGIGMHKLQESMQQVVDGHTQHLYDHMNGTNRLIELSVSDQGT